MKYTAAVLAALSLSALSASAGTPVVAQTGKAVPAAMPSPADPCATPISYNNVELLYAYTDWDDLNDHGNGGILRAEYSPFKNFYLALGAEYHEVSNVDIWAISGGIGTYVELSENIHLAADGGAVWYNYDAASTLGSSANNGFEEDDWGWYVRPHIRAKWGCFEVHAGAQYTKVDDLDIDEWSGFLNLYYQISPGWDLTAGVSHSSERTTVTGGARYRF
jgi:hypothetical protein